jgi:hypothetical protein
MFDPLLYSPAVQSILSTQDGGMRAMPLAPPGPVEGTGLGWLRETPLEALFDGGEIASRPFALCTRSALFLYFSALDESHRISQEIATPTGSFLHGIMHRQEPDYSNAKYWFRRTGGHELFPTLREEALRLPLKTEALASAIQERPHWDPFWFVDQVEKAVQAGPAPVLTGDLERIQQLEWQLVFDYSYRRASSG